MRITRFLTIAVAGAGLLLGTRASAAGDSMGTSGSSNMGQQQGANEKQLSGTLSSLSGNKIVVKADDGTQVSLKTDDTTKFFDQSGNAASLSQLQEGQQIRASYDVQAGENHAQRIDVVKSDNTKKTGSSSDTHQ